MLSRRPESSADGPVVIKLFSGGRSAIIAALPESWRSRWCCTPSNARIESSVPSRTCRSVSTITVCRMMSNKPPVKAQIVSSVARNSCVRRRRCDMAARRRVIEESVCWRRQERICSPHREWSGNNADSRSLARASGAVAGCDCRPCVSKDSSGSPTLR